MIKIAGAAAYHEAGHAVANAALGYNVRFVIACGDTGLTKVVAGERPLFDIAVVCLAGASPCKTSRGSYFPYKVGIDVREAAMAKRLGRFERDILVVIAQLRGEGYSVNIAEKAEQLTGRSISLGAVYATVDRLEKKGLVRSRLSEATPERGGKPKRYYSITAPGERALAETRAADAKILGAVVARTAVTKIWTAAGG